MIFADPFEGVFKALVKDVDIRIVDPEEPGGYSYPYGLTSDSGTVEIAFGDVLRIVNLGDLIKWSGSRYNQLVKAWGIYVARKKLSDDQLDVFNARVTEFKGAF